MKFMGKLLTLLVTVATATMSDVIPEIQSDPPLSLRATLRKFSKTRHHVTNPRGKEKARKYIKKMFTKSGLHVWSEYIDTIPSLRGENIVGMLKGEYTGTADDRIVIVGAHYDTTSRTRGVDDNGSGVTALLQVAKQIGNSGCSFKNTILFVAFDFEEDTAESEYPIPFGSQYFVRNLTQHLNRMGGTIKGALVLEMLANHNTTRGSQNFPRMLSYISPQAYHDVTLDGNKGNFLAVVGRGESDKALMEPFKKFYRNDTNFKIQLVPIPLSGRPSKSTYFEHLRDFYRSDHYNFWENSVSFPAVMVTDTSNFRAKMDKCYHKRCDSMRLIDRNDLEFLKRNTDAVIGAALELSEIDSCHSKNENTLKAESLTSTKTTETSTKTTDVQLDESEIDEEPLMNEPLICYFGDEWNEIVPTSNSKTVSYTILTALVTLIHCVIVVRQI